MVLAGCATYQRPAALGSLDSRVRQAVVVQGAAPDDFRAQLTAWRKRWWRWSPALGPVRAVVGRNGLAPAGEKREGDGRTPSGVFVLSGAFGRAETVPTKLPYRRATEYDFWVDDPKSAQYNRWVTGPPAADSYERLLRDDDLYKYAVIIEYNTDPVVPGKGSAIFLHLWRGPDQPTAGCVAVAENDLVRLLEWLAPARHPVIVLEEPAPEEPEGDLIDENDPLE